MFRGHASTFTVVAAIALSIFIAPQALRADAINVTVDFSGAPSLSQADQDAILAKMKDKYTDLSDVKISTTAGGKITIKFVDDDGTAWGESDKRGKTATVHVHRAMLGDERKAAFDTAAKRQNLWGETGAHELGHCLCAVHNRDNPPSLMTEGSSVPYDNRASDGRSFTDADKMNIKMGVMMINNNQSWDLSAAYDANDFTIVEGVDTGELEEDDSRVAFDVTVSDPLLTVGFMNDAGEYVERVGPGGTGTMEFGAGEFANFAVAFNDQVFQFSGKLANATGSMPRSPDQAATPAQDQPYYGRLSLVFNNVYGQDVVLTLDADAFKTTNGFSFNAPPAATTTPIDCGSGLCATSLLPCAPMIVAGIAAMKFRIRRWIRRRPQL